MHRHSAGGHRSAQAFGGGAFLVRAIHGVVEARILCLAERQVAAESAGGQHHGLVRLDGDGRAAFHVVAAGLVVHDSADHAAVRVLHQLGEHALRLDFDAQSLQLLGEGARDVRAAAVALRDGAHDGVASVRVEEVLVVVVFRPGGAHLDGPLPRLVGLLGDHAALFLVVEVQARHHHVVHVLLDGILHALALLHAGVAHGEVAGRKRRVAADARRLLDYLDVRAGVLRLKRRGQTRVPAAHDQDVALLIPFRVGAACGRRCGLLILRCASRQAQRCQHAGRRRSRDERATRYSCCVRCDVPHAQPPLFCDPSRFPCPTRRSASAGINHTDAKGRAHPTRSGKLRNPPLRWGARPGVMGEESLRRASG